MPNHYIMYAHVCVLQGHLVLQDRGYQLEWLENTPPISPLNSTLLITSSDQLSKANLIHFLPLSPCFRQYVDVSTYMYVHACPCSHYRIIAVPVTRAEDQPRTVPYKPVVPLSELLTHALSKKLVTKVAEHVPFVVDEFQSGDLPPSLRIAGKWVRRAFKHDTYYSFVVVAFTKSKVNGTVSLSLCHSLVSCFLFTGLYRATVYTQRACRSTCSDW